MEKDVGFRIRIDRRLREQFLEVCREQDRPAAQVLREFMRDYVADGAPSNDASNKRARPSKKEKQQ